ncbi:hypothetical protein SAMN05216417_12148 [Nitrosospira multiformis]|uniref:Uncharacterized protein n=1 Tax=Nitrosospira multiformis TaxID=1231 RepID=A0A1I7IM04_9PROT|nr:hypothetical protein SAMN05216417_12148 [Nitrosospira multiformis]
MRRVRVVVGHLRPQIAPIIADVHVDTLGGKRIGVATLLRHMFRGNAVLGQVG